MSFDRPPNDRRLVINNRSSKRKNQSRVEFARCGEERALDQLGRGDSAGTTGTQCGTYWEPESVRCQVDLLVCRGQANRSRICDGDSPFGWFVRCHSSHSLVVS